MNLIISIYFYNAEIMNMKRKDAYNGRRIKRNEIDIILKHLLKANNIKYKEFPANCENTNIDSIIKYIVEQSIPHK